MKFCALLKKYKYHGVIHTYSVRIATYWIEVAPTKDKETLFLLIQNKCMSLVVITSSLFWY